MKNDKKKRTTQQNKAIHKGFKQVAKVCADSGISLKAIMQDLDIPVTKESLKLMYKSVAIAMYGVISTTELSSGQISEVWNVFIKPIEEQTGEYMPFPSQEETDSYYQSFKIYE